MDVVWRPYEELEHIALDYSTCVLVCKRQYRISSDGEKVRSPYLDGSWVSHIARCRWSMTDRND